MVLSGSLVAIVTPMRPDGAVDLEAWTRLLDFHLASGTNGIVVGGTTGESVTLRDLELRELTLRACERCRGKLTVLAGAGTSSTWATAERVRWLSELPVDALLVVTPAYNRPTQEGLYQHFAAAAAASGKPLVLYNVPSRTAVDLLPATVARLARVPRIAGIKEALPEMSRVRELVETTPRGFTVLSGDDASAREAIGCGARGVISVTANVAPRAMAEMVAAALRWGGGRSARARRTPRGAASGAVRRGESDSGQVGAGADGAHGACATIAVDAAVRGASRGPARGRAGRRGAALTAPAALRREIRMTLVRSLLWLVPLALTTAGCHPFRHLSYACHRQQPYMRAASVAPLKVPAGLDAPDTTQRTASAGAQ